MTRFQRIASPARAARVWSALLLGTLPLVPTVALAESEIVVGGSGGAQTFTRTATGNVAPLRAIQGGSGGGVAVDTVHHEIFVADSSAHAIRVFARSANGNVAPVRVIQGAATLLDNPFGMFVDTTHDELYVADGGADLLLVFPRAAHGNVAPIRKIQNHVTDATGFFAHLGVFVDLDHDEVLVSGTKIATDAILVFERTANGVNVPPKREIPGGFNSFLEGLVVHGNEIFTTSGQNAGEVRVYPRLANSPILTTTPIPTGLAPTRTIKGALTGLQKAVGIGIDVASGEIIVTSSSNGSVRTFPIGADGNVAPTRILAGPATTLTSPQIMELASIPTGLPSALVASVLPASRSVRTETTATAFATIINTSATPLTGCEIAPATGPAIGGLTYTFHTTNPATNQIVGPPNQPVNVPANGIQTFVFAFTASLAFPPTDIQLSFQCAGSTPAPIVVGLDTILLSASATPVPDIVALAATSGGNGIVDVSGPSGSGAFAVATVNVGASGLITATADTGNITLPVDLAVCGTNAATGVCTTPIGASATVQIDAGQTPTFAAFLTAHGTFAFDPALHRAFLRFKDQANTTRGATSVAIRILTP